MDEEGTLTLSSVSRNGHTARIQLDRMMVDSLTVFIRANKQKD